MSLKQVSRGGGLKLKLSLVRRIECLECGVGLADEFPTIREAIEACPDERSRRAAFALASEAGILDIRWIGKGTRISRTWADVVFDMDDLVGEEQSKLLVENRISDFRFLDRIVCMLLNSVLDLGRSDHAETLCEVEEIVKDAEVVERREV